MHARINRQWEIQTDGWARQPRHLDRPGTIPALTCEASTLPGLGSAHLRALGHGVAGLRGEAVAEVLECDLALRTGTARVSAVLFQHA